MRRRFSRVMLASLVAILIAGACGNDTASTSDAEGGPSAGDESAERPAPTGARDLAAAPTPGDDPAAPPPLPVAAVLDLLEGLDRLDGGSYELAVPEGQAAVAWFWAPWCPNCRAIAPTVADLASEFGDDLVVVGVAGQGGVDEMHGFVSDTGTEAIVHVIDADGGVWAEFGVTTQPVFAVVEPDGTVEMMIRPSRDALADRFATLATS